LRILSGKQAAYGYIMARVGGSGKNKNGRLAKDTLKASSEAQEEAE
jgi:hypothetical protein